MPNIFDTWFIKPKKTLFLWNFTKVHGHSQSFGDWYVTGESYDTYFWTDGQFHDSMCDSNGNYRYFASREDAEQTAKSFGYELKDG